MGVLFKTFEYGRNANTYDWLKAIALITMIADHLGKFFFPELDELRVVGRVAFPIFLFLVGYNTHYRFHNALLVGAVLVSLSHWVALGKILSLNILWAILLWRWVMSWLTQTKIFKEERFMLGITLIVFYIPVSFLVEYGTLGLLFAILGWQVRQQDTSVQAGMMWPLVFTIWLLAQSASFSWPFELYMALALEGVALWGVFYHFHLSTAPSLKNRMFWEWPTLLLARNTLIIYVVHYAAFAFAAKWLITGT